MKLCASAAVILLGFGSILDLPNLSTYREVNADIEIHASTQLVWAILTDFPAYSIWNPYIYPMTGEVRQGARLELTLHEGAHSIPIQAAILTIQTEKELSWGGRFGWAFERVHAFTIEPVEAHRVKLVSRAFFKGLFLPLVGGVPDQARQGIRMMNSALRTRAELLELGNQSH